VSFGNSIYYYEIFVKSYWLYILKGILLNKSSNVRMPMLHISIFLLYFNWFITSGETYMGVPQKELSDIFSYIAHPKSQIFT
jgi:hypothetical protein